MHTWACIRSEQPVGPWLVADGAGSRPDSVSGGTCVNGAPRKHPIAYITVNGTVPRLCTSGTAMVSIRRSRSSVLNYSYYMEQVRAITLGQ